MKKERIINIAPHTIMSELDGEKITLIFEAANKTVKVKVGFYWIPYIAEKLALLIQRRQEKCKETLDETLAHFTILSPRQKEATKDE